MTFKSTRKQALNFTLQRVCQLVKDGDLQGLKSQSILGDLESLHEGGTPLMHAAASRKLNALACASHLLLAGANVGTADRTGANAMHWAAEHDNPDIVQLLHSRNKRLLKVKDSKGQTPLMRAIVAKATNCACMLLMFGADPEAADLAGNSPMQAAKGAEDAAVLEAVQTAIEEKRKCEAASKEQAAAWESARRLCQLAGSGNLAALSKVANSDNCNCAWLGETPLMRAAACNTTDGLNCFKRLLEIGADPMRADLLGFTTAHHAAKADNADALSLLPIDCLNAATNLGWTPLILSAIYNRKRSATQLLLAGADVGRKCKKKLTAEQYAGRNKWTEMRQMLNEASEARQQPSKSSANHQRRL